MHLPSPEAVPSLSGSPVPRPLAPLLPASRRGPGGRGGLPTPSSTAPLLEAAVDAVRGRGVDAGGRPRRRAGWALQPADGGGSSCPPRQEVLDRLSLLLCSRELMGQVTGLRHRRGQSGIQEPEGTDLCRRPYVNQTQPDGGAPGHKCGIARPSDHAITFVARGQVAVVRSSFSELRIVNHPVHVPQCF